MSSHAKAAKKFIADRERTAWHDQALFFVREKRDRMAHDVPEWEALREMASNMKRHTIANLPYYLEQPFGCPFGRVREERHGKRDSCSLGEKCRGT